MKKILLFALVLGVGYTTLAQQAHKLKISAEALKAPSAPAIGIEPIKEAAITKSHIEREIAVPMDYRNTDIVTIIDIGTSANSYGYGYQGGQKNLVHAEPGLEGGTITNFHRMGGALDPGGYSGDLGYDISTDGGATWTNMNECYVAVDNAGGDYYLDAARYPNHAIYNPTGDIEDAYVVFFAPNLDQSNATDSWGGYSFGVANISDPSDTTGNYNRKATHGNYHQYIPDAYDMTATGQSVVVDVNQDWSSGSLEYQGSLIINRGLWDDDELDFVYEESLLDFEIINEEEQARPAFAKVAFGPDGQTGYIMLIADNGGAEQVGINASFYPIFFKTTDGGENWEGPTAIPICGEDGLGGIVYHHMSDSAIEALYEAPVPEREEISYTTGFDCDIAVDHNNNMHMAVVIGLTYSEPDGDYSISSFEDPEVNKLTQATYDIFTNDGGTTWFAEEMGRIGRFRGEYPDDQFVEDNRIQITTNPDRDRIFISWLDTDKEDATSNNSPNIWCRGFNPEYYLKTADANGADKPVNVTLWSFGMNETHFAAVAQMALEPEDGTYLIPMTYEDMDPTDPEQPVQFKYITDFSFSEDDFAIVGVDEGIETLNTLSEVSQNYPNPFSGNSQITVTLAESSDLSLEVYSITGQQVLRQDYGYTAKGTTTITINGNDLTPGVYFYTVTVGENKVTHKMIVE